MSSQPRDYSVGWICAIETEFVVACELLDEEYSRKQAPRLPLDPNVYRFGRIHEHKIVIACLPKGRYGTNSAALVASQMLQSFPSIRIGLMVGIGGGAPSYKHDIRLGDVVVSSPTPRNGGVVQYDFGKAFQNQEFNITGHLAAPPRVLLNALTAVHAEHERKGHRILDTIQNMIAKNKRLEKKYSRPAAELDRLYTTLYDHSKQENCECLREGSAAETSSRFLIKRRARNAIEDDPAIHYGLIASANTLVKDGILRDQLVKDHEILCFEMEAAGVMNDFPCVVIRGICDYSDSHKNDIWHGYAAAAAASYAKELLEMIPGTEVQEIPKTQTDHASRGVDTNTIQDRGSVSTQGAADNPAEHLDLYKVLNVPEDATTESIGAAYLKLFLSFPQDGNGHNFDPGQQDMLHRIRYAYEILSDDVQRERYDVEIELNKLKKWKQERERERYHEKASPERLVRDRAVRSVSQPLPTPWPRTGSERMFPVTEERQPTRRAARITPDLDNSDGHVSRMQRERESPFFEEIRPKERMYDDLDRWPSPFMYQNDTRRAGYPRPDSASSRLQSTRDAIPTETQETSREATYWRDHNGYRRTEDNAHADELMRDEILNKTRERWKRAARRVSQAKKDQEKEAEYHMRANRRTNPSQHEDIIGAESQSRPRLDMTERARNERKTSPAVLATARAADNTDDDTDDEIEAFMGKPIRSSEEEDSEVEAFMSKRGHDGRKADIPQVVFVQRRRDGRSQHPVETSSSDHPLTAGQDESSSTPARLRKKRRDSSTEAVAGGRRARDSSTEGVAGITQIQSSPLPKQQIRFAAAAANMTKAKSNKEDKRKSSRTEVPFSPNPSMFEGLSNVPPSTVRMPKQPRPAAQGEQQQHKKHKRKTTRTFIDGVEIIAPSGDSSHEADLESSRVLSWLREQSRTISRPPTPRGEKPAEKLYQATVETDSDEEG